MCSTIILLYYYTSILYERHYTPLLISSRAAAALLRGRTGIELRAGQGIPSGISLFLPLPPLSPPLSPTPCPRAGIFNGLGRVSTPVSPLLIPTAFSGDHPGYTAFCLAARTWLRGRLRLLRRAAPLPPARAPPGTRANGVCY